MAKAEAALRAIAEAQYYMLKVERVAEPIKNIVGEKADLANKMLVQSNALIEAIKSVLTKEYHTPAPYPAPSLPVSQNPIGGQTPCGAWGLRFRRSPVSKIAALGGWQQSSRPSIRKASWLRSPFQTLLITVLGVSFGNRVRTRFAASVSRYAGIAAGVVFVLWRVGHTVQVRCPYDCQSHMDRPLRLCLLCAGVPLRTSCGSTASGLGHPWLGLGGAKSIPSREKVTRKQRTSPTS